MASADKNKYSWNQSFSIDGSIHYSWDYAQQVHYPHHSQQCGPIYFKTLRKCYVFGMCCEASAIGHEERLLVLDLNPSMATRLFIEALKKRLQGIILKDIMKHELDADANASGKVLVICNNHTRIDSVLQPILELNCHDRKTLLLVLFQCEKENKFKKVESLSLMKSNYPQIDDIVQIGFDNKRGIYDCEFNDEAISCIEVFAGKEPKVRSKYCPASCPIV